MNFDESIKDTLTKTTESSVTPIFKAPELCEKYPETFYSAVPMLNMQKSKIDMINKDSINDSKCTRFIKKKFFCIVIFLLFSIAMFEFFTSITEKLSDDHISEMYSMLSNTFKKFFILTNVTSSITNDTEINL